MQMLLISVSIHLLSRSSRYGRGIKPRTDEFRQAASRPLLTAGWGCLFSAPDTDTDIHLPTSPGYAALTGWWQANYRWATWQQKATKIRPKKVKFLLRHVTQQGHRFNGQRQRSEGTPVRNQCTQERANETHCTLQTKAEKLKEKSTSKCFRTHRDFLTLAVQFTACFRGKIEQTEIINGKLCCFPTEAKSGHCNNTFNFLSWDLKFIISDIFLMITGSLSEKPMHCLGKMICQVFTL